MIFKPEGFRHLDATFEGEIRSNDRMTLILVCADGSATYSRYREGKDDIVRAFKPDDDLLLMVWTGQWKTDIFQLSSHDLTAFYRT